MKRIIIHWTAGTNNPNVTEMEHYHYLVSGSGNIVQGRYKPTDNLNCKDGHYAQHCGGGNTNSIGVALCGMLGFQNRNEVGKYPLTKIQCETSFQLIAKLCKMYKIPVTEETVITHYEFGLKNPKTSSAGKIDIIYLPCYPKVIQAQIGEFIRRKIKWYYDKL